MRFSLKLRGSSSGDILPPSSSKKKRGGSLTKFSATEQEKFLRAFIQASGDVAQLIAGGIGGANGQFKNAHGAKKRIYEATSATLNEGLAPDDPKRVDANKVGEYNEMPTKW